MWAGGGRGSGKALGGLSSICRAPGRTRAPPAAPRAPDPPSPAQADFLAAAQRLSGPSFLSCPLLPRIALLIPFRPQRSAHFLLPLSSWTNWFAVSD